MTSTHQKYLSCLEDKIFFTQYISETDEYVEVVNVCNEDKDYNYRFSHYQSSALIVAFIVDIALFAYSAIVKNFNLFVAFASFALILSPKLFNFIFKVFLYKFGSEKWKKAARTHAAIHMVMNAYEEYQRVPTVEEAQSFSRYTENCKSFSKEFSLFLYSCVFVLVAIFNFNTIICVFISTAVSLIFNIMKRRLVFLERLILSNPTESDITFVINRLKVLENNWVFFIKNIRKFHYE